MQAFTRPYLIGSESNVKRKEMEGASKAKTKRTSSDLTPSHSTRKKGRLSATMPISENAACLTPSKKPKVPFLFVSVEFQMVCPHSPIQAVPHLAEGSRAAQKLKVPCGRHLRQQDAEQKLDMPCGRHIRQQDAEQHPHVRPPAFYPAECFHI